VVPGFGSGTVPGAGTGTSNSVTIISSFRILKRKCCNNITSEQGSGTSGRDQTEKFSIKCFISVLDNYSVKNFPFRLTVKHHCSAYNIYPVYNTYLMKKCLGMDTALGNMYQQPATSADSATTDQATSCAGSGAGTNADTNILGSVYKQCSTARSVTSNIAITEFRDGKCTTGTEPTPKIGSLDWEGDLSVLKTFHGGRVTKNGRTVNDCISVSFDPRNLQCLCCDSPHHILNPLKPPVIVFSDQNFVSSLNGGPENCAAVVRAENSSLSELADLASEILEKVILPSGSVLLFGSGSHLYKGGVSQYASDWIHLRNRCSQKWPGANICPLIPLVRTDCPGSLARDISMLSAWLGRVYADNASGLLDTWNTLRSLTEPHCEGTSSSESCKIPLPSSISVGSIQPHCFKFDRSCPVILPGIHRKATEDLLRALIENLNRDFQTNLNPEVIIANSWAGKSDRGDRQDDMETSQSRNHVILIGSSNMRRLIPFLKSAGYTINDLTQPSWLATADNVEFIASTLNTIGPEPDTVIVLELFGNSTFRYRQFDGTMALPFKFNNGYHLEGDVGVCDNDSFLRLCDAVGPIFDSCGDSVKIVIPPLPRHLYNSCCGNKKHCTNLKNDEYELSMLQATTRFRPILKEALLKKGLEKFFILDGIGALLGVLPGGNRGAPVEILRELAAYCAADGVHFTEPGYANLAKTIAAAIAGVFNGTLTKSLADQNTSSGKGDCKSFFWRGFVSPVGVRLPPSHHLVSEPRPHDNTPPQSNLRHANTNPGHGHGHGRGHFREGSRPYKGGREPALGRGRRHPKSHYYNPYW
jgi:hypothetical protein